MIKKLKKSIRNRIQAIRNALPSDDAVLCWFGFHDWKWRQVWLMPSWGMVRECKRYGCRRK